MFYLAVAYVLIVYVAVTGEASAVTRIQISSEGGNSSEGCLTGSIPCKSLEFASKVLVNNSNAVEFMFLAGVHVIGELLSFNRISDVSMVGSDNPWSSNASTLKCSNYSTNKFNNLEFIHPHNVTIANIIFEGCGPISSGLYIEHATNLHISDCIFQSNTGHAIKLYNSNASIANSLFFNNSGEVFDAADITSDYGFVVNQSAGGIGIVYTKVQNPLLRIKNCTFYHNHAKRSLQNKNDTRPSDYQPFGTGGGLFIRFANASFGELEIVDCNFTNNSALVRGGAVYVAFWGYSEENRIRISNSLFKENYCNDAGGALSINSFSSSHRNFIAITDSDFVQNEALNSCGAMVYRFSNELISGQSFSNQLKLKRCTFKRNRATSVSAAGFFMFGRVDRRSQPVLIEDTTFDGNMATFTSCERKEALTLVKKNITSAVLAEIPLVLKGTTTFTNNSGGGVTIVERKIDIHGDVIFENNCSPGDGGGLSLKDKSFIQLFSNSRVTFKNNSATIGGAISALTPVISKDNDVLLSFNSLCFLQYQVLVSGMLVPEEWNVTIIFDGNKALLGGGAMYAIDISECTYVPSKEENATDETLSLFNRSLFALTPQFTYRNNIVAKPLNSSNTPIFSSISNNVFITADIPSNGIAPCEIFTCSVQGFDQSSNVQSTVFQINAGDQTCNFQTERFFFVANMDIALATIYDEDLTGHCDGFSSNSPTNITHKVKFRVLDQFTGDPFPEEHLELNITCCHTGYFFHNMKKRCMFDHSTSVFVAESYNKRYVYIKPRLFGQHKEDNQFIYGLLPPYYHKCNIQSKDTTIQGCLFKFDNPFEQCEDNRTGFMCGNCSASEGLTLSLSDCQNCKVTDIVLFVVFCILIMVMSIIIMTFDVGLSNRLRGFLFFAQVVNIVYQRDSGEGTTLDYHLARQFGRSIYLPICLSSTMNALNVVLLGLIIPFLILLMVLLFVYLARHIRYLSQHQSVNGIWLLMFLLYVYTARSCFDLIRCVPVYDVNDNVLEYRYYYNGSITCYYGGHLYYALLSYVLLCTVILPGPFAVALISYRHFKRTAPFKDVATKGIRWQCRWWSCYDLLRRLAFTITIVFEGHMVEYQQLFLTIISVFCLIITARLHPYQSYWNNLIETFILADLTLITAYYLTDTAQSVAAEDTFGIVLLCIPFVYCAVYITILIIKKLWIRFGRKMQEHDGNFDVLALITTKKRDEIAQFVNKTSESDDADYHEYRDELLVITSLHT